MSNKNNTVTISLSGYNKLKQDVLDPADFIGIQDSQTVAPLYSGKSSLDTQFYTVSRTSEEQQTLAQIEIAQKFAATLLSKIKDLDPDYAKLVSDNFWDLI